MITAPVAISSSNTVRARITFRDLEQLRREEAGKTLRLSRTRQKLNRVGVMKLLEDFAMHKSSTDGFDILIEHSLPELTGEAIVLRHKQHFSDIVVNAARARLPW